MSESRTKEEDLAIKQVNAFMRHLSERLGTDEEALQTILSRQRKNGRVYVTWAAIVSLLVTLLGTLLVRSVSEIDQKIFELRKDVAGIRDNVNDSRERLRALETGLAVHTQEGKK